MFWDFRVLRRKVHGREILQVHRAFYIDAEKSQVISMELQPYSVIGSNPCLMMDDILSVVDAFSKPTLKAEHLDIGGSHGPVV